VECWRCQSRSVEVKAKREVEVVYSKWGIAVIRVEWRITCYECGSTETVVRAYPAVFEGR